MLVPVAHLATTHMVAAHGRMLCAVQITSTAVLLIILVQEASVSRNLARHSQCDILNMLSISEQYKRGPSLYIVLIVKIQTCICSTRSIMFLCPVIHF